MIEWILKILVIFVSLNLVVGMFLWLTKKLQPEAYEDIIKCKWGKN
jgi:uncharacterized membrane protein